MELIDKEEVLKKLFELEGKCFSHTGQMDAMSVAVTAFGIVKDAPVIEER